MFVNRMGNIPLSLENARARKQEKVKNIFAILIYKVMM